MTTQSGRAHHEDQEVHRTRGAAFRIIWVHANVPSDAGANFLFKDNGSTRMVCLFISLVLRFASVSLAAYSYRIPGAVSSFSHQFGTYRTVGGCTWRCASSKLGSGRRSKLVEVAALVGDTAELPFWPH